MPGRGGPLIALIREGTCQKAHMNMLTRQHWRFCPWCGIQLQIRIHCIHCGKNFMSQKAYDAHLFGMALFSANPCPNDPEKKHGHLIQYRKHRQRMYCATCEKEYPIKEKP